MHFRLHVVYLLPQVSVLDGTLVGPNEKVDAANMHGADAEGLVEIRRTFFPQGELDDGGGAIPPTSAGMGLRLWCLGNDISWLLWWHQQVQRYQS